MAVFNRDSALLTSDTEEVAKRSERAHRMLSGASVPPAMIAIYGCEVEETSPLSNHLSRVDGSVVLRPTRGRRWVRVDDALQRHEAFLDNWIPKARDTAD